MFKVEKLVKNGIECFSTLLTFYFVVMESGLV